ncbi:MAG: hypothetical protein HY907_06190 [Deltaproteobacteria bacterium]|nr:hypothetical protein [Deltaproteobacteria bacterium]
MGAMEPDGTTPDEAAATPVGGATAAPGPVRESLDATPERTLARVRYVVRWTVIAATLAAGLAFAAGVASDVVRPWLYGFRPWWVSPAGYRFLGPQPPLVWLVAGLLVGAGVGVAAAMGVGRRRWFRVAGGAAGAVGLALLVLTAVDVARFGVGGPGGLAAVPWDVFTGSIAMTIAGSLAALGRLGEPPRARLWRWMPVPAAVVLALGVGYPTISDVWTWYRPQDLRSFHAELVRARRTYSAEVVGESRDVVEANGVLYRLDRSDTMRLTPDDVSRVIWFPPEDGDDRPSVGIRLRSGLHGDLARRSERGMRQYGAWDSDALFIDGRLYLVASYQGLLLDGRMSVRAGETDGELRELYAALTGEEAP